MICDFKLIIQFCNELGFEQIIENNDSVEIKLFDEAKLVFENLHEENDSLVGFAGTPWHTHDTLTFADKNGFYIEMNYLDILDGLKMGTVLVCEQFIGNNLIDRYLVHRDYFDEIRFIDKNEEIRIRRIA